MAKFCTNCGQPIEQGARFCGACGAPLAADPAPAPQTQQPQAAPAPQTQRNTGMGEWQTVPGYADERQSAARGPSAAGARIGIPAPGYSDRVNDPELLAALKKQKRAAGRFASILVPFPLLGFAIYGKISDKMEFSQALLYGAIISAVFLVFSLIGKRQSSAKNAYEGVVIDKQTRARRSSSGSGDNREYTYYNELITVVRTSTGAQKRIVERDNSRTLAWDLLQIGERFRYHPEHGFPYELYDKSHAPYLCCVVCQKKNPVAEDRCGKCGAPLLK